MRQPGHAGNEPPSGCNARTGDVDVIAESGGLVVGVRGDQGREAGSLRGEAVPRVW
ncbi:hypothetical protein CLV92_105280 [Kineococcus xinjiangensis]|uniref:Uncharacterized protein n=1 Tax=Kineococcus xinjiangensis TaxID=512762 RepID=A0A2S6IPP4_9ACTN|nr:hypothetical protein CLV92_105280 [Kineococcus xinjiangensis]